LVSTNWNKSRAAEKMHCSRMTLYRKLQHYKLGPGLEGSDAPVRSSSSEV
jgi:DNA-binding NtrC family response regulator